MTPVSPVVRYGAPEVVFAKDQPEYIWLPAVIGDNGIVTTRWRPSLRERIALLFGGSVYHQQLTWGGQLQPVKMSAVEPGPEDMGILILEEQ